TSNIVSLQAALQMETELMAATQRPGVSRPPAPSPTPQTSRLVALPKRKKARSRTPQGGQLQHPMTGRSLPPTEKFPDRTVSHQPGVVPGSGFTDGGTCGTLFLAKECRYDPHQHSSQCQALLEPGGCYIVHGRRARPGDSPAPP